MKFSVQYGCRRFLADRSGIYVLDWLAKIPQSVGQRSTSWPEPYNWRGGLEQFRHHTPYVPRNFV